MRRCSVDVYIGSSIAFPPVCADFRIGGSGGQAHCCARHGLPARGPDTQRSLRQSGPRKEDHYDRRTPPPDADGSGRAAWDGSAENLCYSESKASGYFARAADAGADGPRPTCGDCRFSIGSRVAAPYRRISVDNYGHRHDQGTFGADVANSGEGYQARVDCSSLGACTRIPVPTPSSRFGWRPGPNLSRAQKGSVCPRMLLASAPWMQVCLQAKGKCQVLEAEICG